MVHAEQASGSGGPGLVGVSVQLGGQTPLKLAAGPEAAGVPIAGTPSAAIDLAEERGAFGRVLSGAGLPAPPYGTATSFEGAREIAATIGYPVLVRPSYLLGGRGIEIFYDEAALADYSSRATEVTPDHPVLVDRFLDDAVEIDVDALCDDDGEVYLGGIMEHIEEAGVHSGDSSCTLPPITLGGADLDTVRASTVALARRIGVRGLLNVQYALKDEVLYVLEANTRASRTVPFVSKATGIALAATASRVMLGATITDLRAEGLLPATGDGAELPGRHPVAVNEAVLPVHRFRRPDGAGVDSLPGPEMKSTGEVMGINTVFGTAFAKAQAATTGAWFGHRRVAVDQPADGPREIAAFRRLQGLGLELVATEHDDRVLRRHGVAARIADLEDAATLAVVDLVASTAHGRGRVVDEGVALRRAATAAGVPCVTTVPGLAPIATAAPSTLGAAATVVPLQDWHRARAPQRDGHARCSSRENDHDHDRVAHGASPAIGDERAQDARSGGEL